MAVRHLCVDMDRFITPGVRVVHPVVIRLASAKLKQQSRTHQA